MALSLNNKYNIKVGREKIVKMIIPVRELELKIKNFLFFKTP